MMKCGMKWSFPVFRQHHRGRDESKLGKHEILQLAFGLRIVAEFPKR
jgi:hypothetical protein